MKKVLLTIAIALISYYLYAQSNTFPLSGYVGIGTMSPQGDLDISGNTNGAVVNIMRNASTGYYAYSGVQFGNSTGPNVAGLALLSTGFVESGLYKQAGTYLYNNNIGGITLNSEAASTFVRFGTANLERMRIDGNGNVGIGITSPLARLHVLGASNALSAIFDGTPGNYMTIREAGVAASYIGNGSSVLTGGMASSTGIRAEGAMHFGTGGDNIRMTLTTEGNFAIGTTDPQGYKLAVNGNAIAESMTVKLHGSWPDYIFKREYTLPSLTDLKTYIDKNQHLPDMPSEQEVKEIGINLGEIVKVQTKKIEELTLYLIEKENQVAAQQKKSEAQDARIAALEAALIKLSAAK